MVISSTKRGIGKAEHYPGFVFSGEEKTQGISYKFRSQCMQSIGPRTLLD